MKTSTEPRSYPVSPVRRWIILGTFTPILLLAGFLLLGEEPQVGLILLLVISPILALAQLVVCYTRLILSSEGVVWRQVGCRIEADWGNIASARLDRGREGFIGHEPFKGPGVKRMAALRGMGLKGVPLYDEQQQAALAEGRFIPLEAFAYAIRNGDIIADLERWAPSLAQTVRTGLADKKPTEE